LVGVKCPVTLYNKGPDNEWLQNKELLKDPGFPRLDPVETENVSHEDYVMLKHILGRWDSLADWTVFVQDDVATARHCNQEIVGRINEDYNGTEAIPLLCTSGAPHHKDIQTCRPGCQKPPWDVLARAHIDLFGKEITDPIAFVASSFYAVPRRVIYARPRAWWLGAMQILEELFKQGEEAGDRSMAAYVFERLWMGVFECPVS